MSSLKDNIAEMIHQLPDETTIEDIQYDLYVLEKIKKGQKQIKVVMGFQMKKLEQG